MAMSSGGRRGGVRSEINVTPLVDVVLVLLIIFMVLTPMMQGGQSVALPKAAQVDPEKKSESLIVSVTPDRKVYVNADTYPDEAALKARLQDEVRQHPERRFVLKADQSLSCGDVRKVIHLARAAGVERVAFGVESLEQK